MPSKPFDARILMLASQATTEITADPSMSLRPEHVPPEALDRSTGGFPWGWADVTVTVTYGGITIAEMIPGVSCTGQREFMAGPLYQEALRRALGKLMRALDKASDALSALGPRREEVHS